MASTETPSSQPPSQEASSAQSLVQNNVRGKTDIAWAHCTRSPDGKSLVCMYCHKSFGGGGIHRVKQHLAGIVGNVEICKKVSAEIRFQMKQHFNERSKKRKASDVAESESFTTEGGELQIGASKKNDARIGTYFLPRTTPGAQPTLKSVMQSKEVVEKCDLAIAKWFIDASIPFNAANSPYFQPAVDALCCMGAGYKDPTMHALRGNLLNKWVDDVKIQIEQYRSTWKDTGCTLMADGWTDRCRRTLINFLVYCPKGTIFIKSVDASGASKTAETLFKLFKEVVLYVGQENVVQVVTDNAANYVAAGKLLEREFPKLFWSPCAAHCINLMLQDMGKLEEVSETVSQASKITKYIYNHCFALYLMRQHTGGREILRPAPTRFATNFIALQSILSHKDALRAMVTSKEWTTTTYSKDVKAKQFVEQVLDSSFWSKCADIVKITEPLVRVLRIVDSEDKPAMGYLYRAMYKAREEIEKRFRRNKLKVEPYLKILDNRWDAQLRKNLHAAGYWLNPSCRFGPEYEKNKSTTQGLLDVIEKYAYDSKDLRSKLTAEITSFKNCEGSFGRTTAVENRDDVLPDQWWDTYGTEAPNLQKLAIRILSQTCSASGCERNWSVFEHIHSKKRNRLEHQKLNDLVYVRYNLRLQNRTKKKQNYDPINFETLGDHSNWVLEDSPPFLTVEEVEALRKDLASMTIQPISNDIDELNLDDVDVEGDAPLNSGENNQSNDIVDGEDVTNAIDFVEDGFDVEGDPNIEIILPPWN
ncbi:uncharacterized protein LOC131660077 [Vicia villosa]|uniref:uncharacterized protein LOC131660077 n=1 Tax=Vicia villosa TaxID=3911 RepID=UPI00273BFE68|nr:uncharacterized protein LOC131660077 [Vicia villosa]